MALSSYHTQRSCGREWEAGTDHPCVTAVRPEKFLFGPFLTRTIFQPLQRFTIGSQALTGRLLADLFVFVTLDVEDSQVYSQTVLHTFNLTS